MGKKEIYKVKKIIMLMLMCIILALITRVTIFDDNGKIFSDDKFSKINSEISSSGYDIKDNIYTSLNNKPHISFLDFNNNISGIKIKFSDPLTQRVNIKVYLAKDGKEFSQESTVSCNTKINEKEVNIKVPYGYYSKLRIDISESPGVRFSLNTIEFRSTEITFLETIKGILDMKFIIILILFILFNFFIKNKEIKFNNKQDKILEIIFIIFCFTMFTLWAIVQPYNSCPDEYMRYDVIKYVFEYNKLPHGGNPLIMDKNWGFSYAFLPYLSGIISAIFMKFMSIFTLDKQALILAARMAVVCFGTLTVYYIIKIANKCFKNEYKWLFIILVSCLPQFVFLGSYMNNDMLALLAVAMMIYYWIEGHEKNWNIRSNIGLAIAVAICLLSYYNAYPFVLFSIVFFIWSNINNKVEKGVIFKKFMTVAIVVFILASWWFIRNAVIYNGDFLGLHTMREYSNIHGIESLKTINRMTPLKQGISLPYMLVKMKWIQSTYLSFIGCFGYMSMPIYKWMYIVYAFIIFTGLLAFGIKLFNSKKEKNNKYICYLCMALSGIITILLSVYNSYAADFQPQGRYIMACIIPLMMFITIGFQYINDLIKNKLKYDMKKIILAMCAICILISILCFIKIIIPEYNMLQ